jgi:uncharacterized protein
MPIDVALARRVLNPHFFELIVLPTEQCNFRCTYCYEEFAIGRMKRPTVEGLMHLISARADGSCDLALSWFGGEPLLATDIILEVCAHARARFASCGRSYIGHITTNAYRLSPDLFLRLLDVGVRKYQITLDGPREVHNRTRLRRDGRGTFDRIWENLLAISEIADKNDTEPFEVSLRLHYDGRSVALISPLIEDLEKYFAKPNYFQVNLHELERLGGARDDEIVPVSEDGQASVREYAARLARAGLHTIVPAEGLEDYICYAAKANSLIIRATGRIAKCTVALYDDYNDIGQLHPDGRVEIEDAKLKPWLRGLSSGDPEELKCPNVGFPREGSQKPILVTLGPTRAGNS